MDISKSTWPVTELRSLCDRAGEYGANTPALQYDASLPRYIRITDIDDQGRLIPSSLASLRDEMAEPYLLAQGNLLLARTGSVGKSYLYSVDDGKCAHAGYLIKFTLDPCKCNFKYISHWARSDHFWQQVLKSTRQAVQGNINAVEYGQFVVPLPDIEIQAEIARILDRVDEAIAISEALINKLKYIKKGLMQDLLTRGLDDNDELRDPEEHPEQFKNSPIGRTPKLWEVGPLGSCLIRIDQGWSPNCHQEATPAGEWGVLKTTAVMWDGYFDQENKRLPSGLSPIPAYEVLQDDVLMTRAGPNSRVGVIAWVNETQGRLMLSDKLYRLVHNDRFLARFLSIALSISQTQMHLSRLKTGMAESQTNISQSIVKSLWVLRPPLPEQHGIVSAIDKIEMRLKSEQLYYEKMKLIKKGLMQDLLTGRVRVNTETSAKEK